MVVITVEGTKFTTQDELAACPKVSPFIFFRLSNRKIYRYTEEVFAYKQTSRSPALIGSLRITLKIVGGNVNEIKVSHM